MENSLEEDVYDIACGLPFSEYENKLIEMGKENPAIVISVLLQPEFICKEYEFKSICKILKELVKTNPRMIREIAKGLKFYDGEEWEDIERRGRVKKILLEISNEDPEFNKEIIINMCTIMFHNTYKEPFEIVSKIVVKNFELSFLLMEWLEKRLREDNEGINKKYLRVEMMNMMLEIMENIHTERKAKRVAEATLKHLGKDEFFENLLLEMAKRFSTVKGMVLNWRPKNQNIAVSFESIRKRLKEWEEETKKPSGQISVPVIGFRGRKHRHKF